MFRECQVVSQFECGEAESAKLLNGAFDLCGLGTSIFILGSHDSPDACNSTRQRIRREVIRIENVFQEF